VSQLGADSCGPNGSFIRRDPYTLRERLILRGDTCRPIKYRDSAMQTNVPTHDCLHPFARQRMQRTSAFATAVGDETCKLKSISYLLYVCGGDQLTGMRSFAKLLRTLVFFWPASRLLAKRMAEEDYCQESLRSENTFAEHTGRNGRPVLGGVTS